MKTHLFQRVPKLQAEDQAIWWDTLNKMQKILRKSAASLGASAKLDKDQMHNYFMSGNEKKFTTKKSNRIIRFMKI